MRLDRYVFAKLHWVNAVLAQYLFCQMLRQAALSGIQFLRGRGTLRSSRRKRHGSNPLFRK
jgi:hypothetical protein